MYLVSILVSLYNEERYVERCARSCFEQSYSDLEFVFVDDASTDQSVTVLERVIEDYPERKPFVKIIHHNKNKGLAATRNSAFDNACGDFFCVVDGDDWLEADGVQRLVEGQIRTGADVVWGRAIMHTEEGEIELSEPRYQTLEEWRMCYFHFTQQLYMVNWRRLIRRELLEKHHIRHEEGLHIGNDKQFMPLIAYYADSFCVIDDIVYHYERRNPSSRTYKSSHGIYDLFAHTREIESMRRVIAFLADKEPAYLEAAQSSKLERLLIYRKEAIRNRSLKGFKIMVKWIQETPEVYLNSIDWNSSSIRIKLKSNYYFSRLFFVAKNMMRNIIGNL